MITLFRVDMSEYQALGAFLEDAIQGWPRQKQFDFLCEVGQAFSRTMQISRDGDHFYATVEPEVYEVLERHGVAIDKPAALKT